MIKNNIIAIVFMVAPILVHANAEPINSVTYCTLSENGKIKMTFSEVYRANWSAAYVQYSVDRASINLEPVGGTDTGDDEVLNKYYEIINGKITGYYITDILHGVLTEIKYKNYKTKKITTFSNISGDPVLNTKTPCF